MSPSVEPFDEAKYKALMDGLNCNERLYSDIFADNSTFRFDSEFFDKEIFEIEKKIKLLPHFYLKLNEVVSGPFGSSLKSESYLNSGDIPFIRIENIKGGFDINMDNIVYISQYDNDRIKNSQLKINDIVLSKVGNSIGFFARVDETIETCNISENNIGIKLSDYSDIEKHYILSYLNSFYAQKLVLRRTSGNAQPKLNVGDLCCIPIPKFSNGFYKHISSCILESKVLLLDSKQLYSSVEKMVVDSIEVNSFNIDSKTIAVRTLSNSLDMSGRLDAEYYQPIYEEIECQMDTNYNINSACKIYDNNFIPENDSIYQYIELADVDMFGGISAPDWVYGKELPSRARRIVKNGQVIISSIEGSLKSCALITEEFDNALCSTGFYVIDSEKYNPETLLILFKSEPMQMLLKKRCSGTILTAISKEEFLKMPIPHIDREIQNEIAEKVRQSFKLRKESKRLLECAVRTVEMAIESDENTAIKWLEMQL